MAVNVEAHHPAKSATNGTLILLFPVAVPSHRQAVSLGRGTFCIAKAYSLRFCRSALGGLSQNATLAPVPQPTRTQPPHYLENKKVTRVLGEYLRYFWNTLVPRSRSSLTLTGAVPLLRLDAPKGGTQEIDRPGVPPFVLASLAGSPPPPVKALRLRFCPHWLSTASGRILEIEFAHNYPLMCSITARA